MSKINYKPCYLCGSVNFKRRDGVCRDNKSVYPIECEDCGLVTLSTHNTIDATYFADSHMHDYIPCDKEIISQQMATDIKRRLEQLYTYLSNKNVLDFGCGNASLLMSLRGIAASCTGIEVDRQYADLYSENGITVYSSIEHLDKTYDTIFFSHVLDHLNDPISIVQKLKNYVSKNGCIIIETPNADDILLKLYKNKEFQQFTYYSSHLYLFNERTLCRVAQKAGYKAKKIIHFQRYPIANHLFWLAQGKPGGQNVWEIFNQENLMNQYAQILAENKMSDTILGIFEIE